MMGIRMPPRKPAPPSFAMHVRAVVEDALKLKDAGYTNTAILAAVEKGLDAGKEKADAEKGQS